MRNLFFLYSCLSLLLVYGLSFVWSGAVYWLIVIVPLIIVGIFDIFSHHNILRNYPVIGHLRYMLEAIRPQVQQYFVATDQSERPFSREIRNLVYRRAKGVRNTLPFGTQQDIEGIGYEFSQHSLSPKEVDAASTRKRIGGKMCKQPYDASRLNISALGFGAISKNAVMALNRGAKEGGFAQNTGEGGITPYHLEYGGDLVWQFGTGYFGARSDDGGLDREMFKEKAALSAVKMIEVKLSQGAKPSHGSLLPGVKVDAEIAQYRVGEVGKDSVSPPAHSEFLTPRELITFIAELRELSDGKPIGFKLCVGIKKEFMGICKAMVETGVYPDFITIDGAEGGTGAAPVEFTNRLGLTVNEAIIFVHNCLVGIGVRDDITLISSGKVATGYDLLTKLALGADTCNSARAMMFALGCLQSLVCNTNKCPTGVATQDPQRVQGLVVEDKYIRVANYQEATIEAFVKILGAMGLSSPDELTPAHVHMRVTEGKIKSYAEIYPYLKEGELLGADIHSDYAHDWQLASADKF